MNVKPNPKLDWPIAYDAVLEIGRSEGCKLKAYRCPAGVPTIGWGHTRGVKMGDTCTQEQADAWFVEDLTEFTDGVKRVLKRDADDSELGAMVSLAYNIGLAGFKGSTVLKRHNEGDRQSAARAFALWNKARINGVLQVVDGLTARRAREAALYLSDDDMPMPQTIEPESSLKSSPIAQASVAATAAAVLGTLTESTETGQLVAAALGIQPVYGVLLAVLWSGGVSLYQRMKQRKEGWA